jgi:hypothetical protein
MRWTEANERTVKNWLAGTGGPSREHLVGIIRHSDGALDALPRLSGRQPVLPALKVASARDYLDATVGQIDVLMDEGAADR